MVFDSSKINDCSVNLAVTHVLKISTEVIENVDLLSRKVEKFWDLDTLGIADKEPSVYEKFVDDISFRDNRYEVHLPFKENHPLIEDHYELNLKRLNRLKCKLEKTPGLLKEYDDDIKQRMVANVVERAESSGEVGAVTYIPHRAVIRDDKQQPRSQGILPFWRRRPLPERQYALGTRLLNKRKLQSVTSISIKKYSSVLKLTAFVLRFVDNLKKISAKKN